jgi:hypothetical protein
VIYQDDDIAGATYKRNGVGFNHFSGLGFLYYRIWSVICNTTLVKGSKGGEKSQIGAKDVIDASINTGVQRELCKKVWFHRSRIGLYWQENEQ